eukprot:CAMPEP_0176499374 /NCGR_PEP_ID=MMETSP0200_2-20121128/12891_1 /TAXON_ID=947934 /ORGANISM="Chaetoceros sp., Strain GSL56" /LENGTH=919 /DNA_ID=CAMNT_0017897785 /DNA_START=130 /DNA_END=2889 /DNA_ORIENTATION=-
MEDEHSQGNVVLQNPLQQTANISTTSPRQHSSIASSIQEANESTKKQRLNNSLLPLEMTSADFQMSTSHSNGMNPVLPDTLYSAPTGSLMGNTVQFEQNLYQQSLAGVTKMVTSAPTSSISSDENLGDSSTTSSSLQFQCGKGPLVHPQLAGTHIGLSSHHHGNNYNNTNGHQLTNNTATAILLAPHSTTLGGVTIPPVPPNSSTAMQVQVAAAAAAAAAAPPKGFHGPRPHQDNNHDCYEPTDVGGKRVTKRVMAPTELSAEEKKRQNRERNREHAKSTRARKKAYINKLKELVDGLHAERSIEARKRRVAMQHLTELQIVRRDVIKTFLQFHANYEPEPKKWERLLEDSFYLKQPVTPFRSFQKSEIENTRDGQQCRKSHGIDAMIRDSASVAVMVENVGNRSDRWKNTVRDEFLRKEETRTGKIRSRMPRDIVHQDSRFQHAISSLSSSSGYSTGNGSSEEEDKKSVLPLYPQMARLDKTGKTSVTRKKVSSSSSGGSSEQQPNVGASDMFHDYHAKPLPDPKLDSSGSTGSDSLNGNDSDNAVVGKLYCSDSLSRDDVKVRQFHQKKRPVPSSLNILSEQDSKPSSIARETIISEDLTMQAIENSSNSSSTKSCTKLPRNIAQSGGIVHNVRPVLAPNNIQMTRFSNAPAVQLPPFIGLGKRPRVEVDTSNNDSPQSSINPEQELPSEKPSKISELHSNPSQQLSNLIGVGSNDGSSDESCSLHVQASYHVNEDSMLLTDDVLMCPFIFRTQDAVQCGALAECVMPGMLRAQFSSRNKLLQLEMVYDAMGFMQQLGRASGNEAVAEIVPNSLEMSLQPCSNEARVITLAKSPYPIVSVNAVFTKYTKFTQMDAENKDLSILEGRRTDPSAKYCKGKPNHTPSSVAQGSAACSTNLYYDKYGKGFVAFVTSYPLTT